MKKVAVLLAMYNAEVFVENLLNSLLYQSYRDFDVYVHDDISADNSRVIIKDYGKRAHFIHFLEDGTKRGAKGSFMWLLQNVDADYYMFCDQDDLWLPNKIRQSVEYIEKLEKEHPGRPVCVHTDLAVADANYNIIAKSLWKQSRVKPNILEDKDYIQVFNCVTGCTMIFNQQAKECSIPMNEAAPMHDFWVAYQTLVHGGVLSHLPYSTILYCQHGNNEVGANDVGIKYIFKKFSDVTAVYKNNVEKYKQMHQISGISWMRYLYCKITFEIRRLL